MGLVTCLWFDGRAREAANFYASIFPDSSVEDNWIAPTDTPGNKQGEEIVVNFKIFGQPFIGLNGGPFGVVRTLSHTLQNVKNTHRVCLKCVVGARK